MYVRRPSLSPWILGALVAVVSCAGHPEPPDSAPYYDLVEQFPLADVQRDTRNIDFGAPAARGHLAEGWSSYDEVGLFDDSTTFVWSDGPRSSIEFFVTSPRDIAVTLRGAPFVVPQTVAISMKDQRIATLEMSAGLGDYHFTIPKRELTPGVNRMDLEYSVTVVPSEVGDSHDNREIGIGIAYLRLAGLDTSAVTDASADPSTSTLVIPVGMSLEYYFRMAPDSFMSFDAVEVPRNGSALEIELEHHLSGRPVVLSTLEASSLRRIFQLPDGPSSIVRLSLRGVAGSDAPPQGRIVLTNPVVLSSSALPEPPLAPTVTQPGRPNVIIYLIDALRPDHLGCYGYASSPSPNIDAFAHSAALYENAFAQSAWTRASVASLFTGRCLRYHKVHDRDDALSEEALTLAEILASHGYETAAFTTNANAGKTSGFGQGFDDFTYIPPPILEIGSATSKQVNQAVFSWLERRTRTAPFFLYIHTTDPHGPYTPALLPERRSREHYDAEAIGSLEWLGSIHSGVTHPDEAATKQMESLYDEEIRFTDRSFGELLSRLKMLDLYENSLVVLLSDHGEEFFDHGGWEHGKTLYNEQIHIPLLVKFPRQQPGQGTRIHSTAQQMDILPTVLEQIGGAAPPSLEGRPLRRSERPEKPIYSYLGLDGVYQESAISWPFKILHRDARERDTPWLELYRLDEDPREQTNLASAFPVLKGFLYAIAKTHLHADAAPQRTMEIDETTLERLKALGYVR